MEIPFRLIILLAILTFTYSQSCDPSICSCQSSLCTSCISNYFYMSQGSCQICDNRCRGCVSDNNCSTQYNCASSYYLNPSTSMCEPCQRSCQVCTNPNNCVQCGVGYALSNGSCVQCLAANVLTCDTPTTVSVCRDGFWKNGDSCMPCRQNCLQCSGPTSCSQCAPGYLKQMAAGTFCGACVVGCLTCSTNSTCDMCQLNFNLVNGLCVNITSTCLTTIPNCLFCSSTSGLACTVCRPFYYFSNGGCIYGASVLCQAGAVGPQPYKCSSGCQSGTYKELTTNSNISFSCLPQYEINGGSIYQLYYYASYSFRSFVPSTIITFGCGQPALYATNSTIALTRVMSPYYKLIVSGKLYPLYLVNYTANGNQSLNITIKLSDNSSSADFLNLTNVKFNSSCIPVYFNLSTRNISQQLVTISITATIANTPSTTFKYGLIGLTQLYIQAFRCSDDCRICSNSNYCLQCKQLFVSNNQCVDNCGGLFQFYLPNANKSNYTSKTCLSSCPTTFYPNISSPVFLCLKCQPPCLSCRSLTQCLSCTAGTLYYAQNFSCLQTCPLGYYPTPSSCLQCNTPCRTCQSETLCTSCSIGFYNGSHCVAKCQDGTYEFQNSCERCEENCRTCNITGRNCLSCREGLVLYNLRCVQSCPENGYYLEEIENRCVICKSPCLNCLAATVCLSCMVGYLQNNSCLPNCPVGSYPEPSNNTCQVCTNNCSVCLSKTICQSCLTGYFIYQSTCVSTCPAFYYPAVGICSPCSLPCSRCIAQTQCLTCQGSFLSKIQNYTCVSVCQDTFYGNTSDLTCVPCQAPCLTCTSQTSCLKCVNSTVLQGTSCLTTCNIGFFNQSNTCQPCSYPCTTCLNSSTSCLSCFTPFILRINQCVSQCVSGQFVTSNRTCEPCSGDCLTCTSPQHCTSCLKSLPQKYLHVSSCISPCPTQTFPDSMSLQCRPCVFPCQTCTDSLNCLSCEIGFLNLQTNRCDFCPANEFADLKTKSCVPCNTTIKDCATCTNETWCTRCVLGGFLYMGGCVTEQQCARVDGYYLNTQQGACVQCISPCRTCVSQIACTACLTGFLIQANSTCSNRCPFSFYADSNSKVCLPCNYTVCRTCTNTPNTCLDCFNDSSRPSTNLNFSILFNRTCINSSSCPKQYYIEYQLQTPQCLACVSPCRQCLSVDKCLSCWTGLLLNNSCVANCPASTFSVSSNGTLTCQQCSPNCTTCWNTSTFCLSCKPGHLLQQGTCVTHCSNLSYPDANTLSCLTCRSPCLTCTSILNCTSCTNNMMLFFGQCVQICPDGSYPNGKVCSVCPMKCQKCRYENETVQCTMCSSNKFMIVTQPGECIEQCPSSWYADLATYQCYQCQTPCERCSSATSCVTCVVGYLVFNRECVKGNQCPNGSYLLYNQSKCQMTCPAPYYSDPLTGKCSLNCTNNYLKHKQMCVLTCPEGFYINASMQCNSCYDNSGKYLPDCANLLTFQIQVKSIFNKLFVRMTFSQNYGSLNMEEVTVTARSLLEVSRRMLVAQTIIPYRVESIIGNSITLELLPTHSLTQQIIEVRLRNYLITDKGVLQNLNSSSILNQYDLYSESQLQSGTGFQDFSKALAIITTLAFLFAFTFNMACVAYPLTDCLQLLFLILFCNIDFSPNLNHFLFGLRYLHFLYLPQIFAISSQTTTTLLKISPNKFGTVMTDITFLGNTGPAFILLFSFFGILLVCKIADLIVIKSRNSIANQSTVAPPQPNLACRIIKIIVERFKWNYSNDVVFVTYYYLAIFSMAQMINFGEKSGYNYVSNFFSVVFILFAVAVPVIVWVIIRANTQAIADSKEQAITPLRCFYYRCNPQLTYSLYSASIRYCRKLLISLLIVIITNYPHKTNYPTYLLGLLTVISFITIILISVYKPYQLNFQVGYHITFECLFFLVLLCLSVVSLGYEVITIGQKIAAGYAVIALTLVLFVCGVGYVGVMAVAAVYRGWANRDILECFSKVKAGEGDKTDKDEMPKETESKMVFVPQEKKEEKCEEKELQSDGADSDFNPQLRINSNAPQILIKCIKNLETLDPDKRENQNQESSQARLQDELPSLPSQQKQYDSPVPKSIDMVAESDLQQSRFEESKESPQPEPNNNDN